MATIARTLRATTVRQVRHPLPPARSAFNMGSNLLPKRAVACRRSYPALDIATARAHALHESGDRSEPRERVDRTRCAGARHVPRTPRSPAGHARTAGA